MKPIRFTFPCPGNGVEIEGVYNPETQSYSLLPNDASLDGRDTATANQVIEFCKTKRVRGVTWDEAKQYLKEQGVDL